MQTSPVEHFIERASESGRKVKRAGSHWLVSCPGPNHAHGDRDPSLHVSPGRNGGAVLRCFAGCANRDIVEALGMTLADLFDGPSSAAYDSPDNDVAFYAADYDYADADGTVLYQVRRLQFLSGKKSFVQRQPDGRGWRNNLNGIERTLYRLPELSRAVASGEAVWLVEGEKDVLSLVALGKVATTAGAVTAWRDELIEHLRGARSITVVADRDVPGYAHALRVEAALAADGWPAERVRVLVSPFGKDVTDHLEAGHTLDELVPLNETQAPGELEPGEVDPSTVGLEPVDWHEAYAGEAESEAWLVEPFLAARRHHLLYAPHKVGKSLFLLELAAAVATGRAVFGRPTGEGESVLVVDMENNLHDDVVARLTDFGYEPHELDNLHYYSFPRLAPLDAAAGAAQLEGLIERHQPVLVVLDSFARVVTGEESDADTVRDYYRHTGLMLKRAGVTSVRLDNSGKEVDRGARGSSAKGDDVDIILQLRKSSETLAGVGLTVLTEAQRTNFLPAATQLLRATDDNGILAHRLTISSAPQWPAGVVELAAALDRIGVPLDATRSAARVAMRAATPPVKADTAVIGPALIWRRTPAKPELPAVISQHPFDQPGVPGV